MTGKDIAINTQDGSFGAYLATPSAGKGPGIIIIQEIFGVNGFVRAVADNWAARGYFALAPDLFWRLEPGVQTHGQERGRLETRFRPDGTFRCRQRCEGYPGDHHLSPQA